MDESVKIRRPTPPSQRASSFTGMDDNEGITSIALEELEPQKNSIELEYKRIQRRLEKLEMLLDVYDIPLPPWKDR